MFLALLAETIVDSLVLSCVVLAVVIAMVIIVYRETNALIASLDSIWHRRQRDKPHTERTHN